MKGIAYLIQATLITLWWIGLLLSQDLFEAFQFPGIGKDAFFALMLPDLVIVALLSIYRAYKPIKELEFVILGGFGFATLYCVNASILTGGGWLATTVMTLGLCYNLFLISGHQVFKQSTSNNLYFNGLKTFIQIICIWVITLFVFPVLLINSFGTGLETPRFLQYLATLMFVSFSLMGLYSAFVMVKIGKGTPLPLDQTQHLVIAGPYRIVRNPMAIAGIGQAIAIGIYSGSVHICLYALLGALLWHFVVRPLEEKDMEERFGQDYLSYKSRVRCWIPRLS